MAGKSSSLETDWARAPPPSGPFWRTFANALYNPDEKSFLGRTPKRWGIVLVFYTVYYAVLTLMFAACMGGLFLTLDSKMPTYTLDKSLIGNNPGVAFRPRPQDGLVVRYNLTGYEDYVDQLNEFFEGYPYTKPTGDCSEKDSYGYPETPCFFIKLNRIIGWKPDCYDDKDNLPEDMPEDLKDYIKALDASELKQIWVSCWEEKHNDTKIEYPWGRGMPARQYPFNNDMPYVNPLLTIKVTPPANSFVVLRCRFWAKNIIYNKSLKEPSGYTRIQLSIGEATSANSTGAEN